MPTLLEQAPDAVYMLVTNPCDGPVERLMLDVAREMGVEESYRKTPVGVYFGRPGETVADPYFGGEGPARTIAFSAGVQTRVRVPATPSQMARIWIAPRFRRKPACASLRRIAVIFSPAS